MEYTLEQVQIVPLNNPEILSKIPICFNYARYVTKPLLSNNFNKENKILCKLNS